MEQPQNPIKKPGDDVSREAHKMFMGHQVDALQEALQINRIVETILKYADKEILNLDMPLGEALEKLAHIQGELTGEKEEENTEGEP